jgi:hypothetical protein
VFDAFGWCASDQLEWRAAAWDASTPIDGSDPARMVFVTRRGAADFLPRELAAVHAFGLGLTDELALAPWAIDDATDQLYARRVRPHDALWLAADNLNALFWGLHDWAHFHNHGDFEMHQRAWTELQCDTAALAWLWVNRDVVPLADDAWEALRTSVEALASRRFEEDEEQGSGSRSRSGSASQARSILAAGSLQRLIRDSARTVTAAGERETSQSPESLPSHRSARRSQ